MNNSSVDYYKGKPFYELSEEKFSINSGNCSGSPLQHLNPIRGKLRDSNSLWNTFREKWKFASGAATIYWFYTTSPKELSIGLFLIKLWTSWNFWIKLVSWIFLSSEDFLLVFLFDRLKCHLTLDLDYQRFLHYICIPLLL